MQMFPNAKRIPYRDTILNTVEVSPLPRQEAGYMEGFAAVAVLLQCSKISSVAHVVISSDSSTLVQCWGKLVSLASCIWGQSTTAGWLYEQADNLVETPCWFALCDLLVSLLLCPYSLWCRRSFPVWQMIHGQQQGLQMCCFNNMLDACPCTETYKYRTTEGLTVLDCIPPKKTKCWHSCTCLHSITTQNQILWFQNNAVLYKLEIESKSATAMPYFRLSKSWIVLL